MNVITSGSTFLDIDAYAGIIGLAELNNLCGQESIAFSSAPLNASITPSLRKLGNFIKTSYKVEDSDTYTLVDVSVPEFFDSIVDISKIEKIIDHHPGNEKFWNDRIGINARIEVVGAACTQVVEEWELKDMLPGMSSSTAKLLAAGILDNTLNFGAKITSERDRAAYQRLVSLASLPIDFAADYFNEYQRTIESDLKKAVKNDIKTGMKNLPPVFGQLLVWDAKTIIDSKFNQVEAVCSEESKQWVMNLISLKEGKSFILATDFGVQSQMASLLGVVFQGNIAQADRLWLRKEILAETLK